VRRCLQWRQDRIVADALASMQPAAPTNQANAEERKAIADAELAEIKVSKARSEVIAVQLVAKEFRDTFSRIRSAVLSKRGEYRSQFLNLESLAEADGVLARLCDDILSELQARTSSTELDDDDGPDSPGDPDGTPEASAA
jgi:hypothetical protein